MKITEMKIKKKVNHERLKAVVSVVFDNVFAVHDLKIIKNEKGYFVAMPSMKQGEVFRDTVHPINKEFREYIETEILKEYEK